MSFFPGHRGRPLLPVDGATAQEPPLKRLRSLLGTETAVGDFGYGVGTAFGLPHPGLDPLSIASFGRAPPDASLFRGDAMAWPLRAGLDEQMLAASGLSASLGSLGSLGMLGSVGTLGVAGSLGSLGSLGMPSVTSALMDRNLPKLDASLVMQGNPLTSLKDLSALLGNPLISHAGIQLSVPNGLSKTRLCKHFIENNCKFKELCNFAHSIEELKRMPGERDLEGKLLLEQYKAKADAEKHFTKQDTSIAPVVEVKTKLCKHFIDGECRFKEKCRFAHSIAELKKLPEDGDDAGKALLERYKAKVGIVIADVNGEPTLALELSASTPVAKTKLCKYFMLGNCKYTEGCMFAHGIEELKSFPGEGNDAGRALLDQFCPKMDYRGLKQDVVKEALAPDETVRAEAEKTPVEAQTALNLESRSNLAAQVKEEDKFVRLLKTKMCRHFMIGACKYSKNCTFAHAIEELKPPPDAYEVMVKITPAVPTPSSAEKASSVDGSTSKQVSQTVQASQQADAKQNEELTQHKDDMQGSLKTKPCKFFSLGTCRFGIACAFIHNEQVHGMNSNGGASQSGGLQVSATDTKPTYKTRLCNMWEKDQTCSFGSKCNFAHGIEELRQRASTSVPVTNSFPATNSLLQGDLELEALSRAQQLGLSSSLPYSYDITDTNWRPFQAAEEAFHGLGAGLGLVNERLLDAGAAETLYLRTLLQNYGQVEQASSLAQLPSSGGVNMGLTSTILPNMPSGATRIEITGECILFTAYNQSAMVPII